MNTKYIEYPMVVDWLQYADFPESLSGHDYPQMTLTMISDMKKRIEELEKEKEELENPDYEFIKSLPKPKMKDPQNFLDVIIGWQMVWAFQIQNNEQDFKNYFHRAMSIDANMKHHLATLCKNFAEKKYAKIDYFGSSAGVNHNEPPQVEEI